MSETILLLGDSYSDQNLYYKTRFLAGDPFIFLEQNGRGTLVVSALELGRARRESTIEDIRSFRDYGHRELVQELGDRNRAFTEMLWRVVRDAAAENIEVDRGFPALHADNLREHGVEIAINPDLLRRERRQKSPEEVEFLAESQKAAEQATARAIGIVERSDIRDGTLYYDGDPLTSERLRREVEVFLLDQGMSSAHEPILAGGPGAADGHWLGAGPLRAGESIVMDIFPHSLRNRYWGDITRTVVKGHPPDILRQMYDTVLEAQGAALSKIRAGANGRDIHQTVLDTFESAGFGEDGSGPKMNHGTGHGVGLDIHEAPGLGAFDEELLPGDVITVEPGLYDPAIGGVRIEDMVVVTGDGYRNLTTLEKRFEV